MDKSDPNWGKARRMAYVENDRLREKNLRYAVGDEDEIREVLENYHKAKEKIMNRFHPEAAARKAAKAQKTLLSARKEQAKASLQAYREADDAGKAALRAAACEAAKAQKERAKARARARYQALQAHKKGLRIAP